MSHIIKYSRQRESYIKSHYSIEHAQARQIPMTFEQKKGDELIETEFTANELLALDKTIRETFGNDYQIVNVEYKSLWESGNGKSYISYAIVHKDLFLRSKAKWDKELNTFCYGKNPIVIPAFRNVKGGYYSCEGYIWLTFCKVSNSHVILFRSSDVETCGFKGKYKRHWDKIGHLYMISEVLFDKYIESVKDGIENVKAFFNKFV